MSHFSYVNKVPEKSKKKFRVKYKRGWNSVTDNIKEQRES